MSFPMKSATVGALLAIVSLLCRDASAVSGEYASIDLLDNKRLPYPVAVVAAIHKDECLQHCIKNENCTAFAISEFRRECQMYTLVPGIAPVISNGYKLWVRRKTEEEGYYMLGTQYIRFYLDRNTASGGQKVCEAVGGRLANPQNQEANDVLVELMTTHTVFEAFIGLTDEEEEMNWKWSTGAKPGWTNWNWDGVWRHPKRNCAVITISGYWRHYNCDIPSYYFCEIPMF